MEQFTTYFKTLVEWNEKMNLTAITDENEVY
ncbi:class I SAM-dependent methyltransferase, partial [Vibrio parahaemolyticus]|nr:class I SAM-dependent methyltransferase [Vibrio parahaemolyticus]